MNGKKRLISLCLAAILLLTITACAGTPQSNTTASTSKSPATSGSVAITSQTKDPFLTGAKPTLNILTRYKPYNMKEQPSYKIIEEMTGYKVNWFMLPEENSTEKLLLEIAGGTSYDLCSQVSGGADQLNAQNALLNLKPYLDKYGANIYAAIPDEMSMKAITNAKGEIYCLRNAVVDEPAKGDDPYGCLKGGIGFNLKYLTEMGKSVPTNLVDFYDVLKAYTTKTGKPALTQTASGWNVYILAGFGMGNATWYEVDGKYIPRIRHPGTVNYLTYMQKLYKEGLLDNDFPVNTAATSKEKFTNGTALAYPVNFWDIDGIYSAFKASGIDTKVEAATFLAADANTAPVHYISQGVGNTSFIPKTAKNPEHAVIYFNMLSDTNNYRRVYIGVENVSYEVKDGNYYPIFPAFNDYLNADMFVGVQSPGELFKMWQARARKTEAMAAIHKQMNARISKYDIKYFYTSYASSLEAVQKNETALGTMVNDSLIQAIATGENPQTAINNIIAKWEKTGGLEYEAAMQKWYQENKANFK